MSHVLRIGLEVLLALIVVAVAAVMIGNALFLRTSRQEAAGLLASQAEKAPQMIQSSDLTGLPACVQKWLIRSQVVGKEKVYTVRLKQRGVMRTTPEGSWMPFEAEQYFTVAEPGFVWTTRVSAAPLLFMSGRDHYIDGHGSMLIMLESLVPVVKTRPGPELDQGTLLRYLGEVQWFPAAALSPYIKWEAVDDHSARATMSYQGVTGSAVFTFNDNGDLVRFAARRPREVNGRFELTDWGGVTTEYGEFHGTRIPVKSDVIWGLESGEFNWLKVEITEIEYNQPRLYQ